uniref:Uncharacterized protein n=2 Tax=Meloidogyne enterolobii TaxID=390850 RepID=A0A6V7XMN6_MELEN|nr:unnamed protein product [Meloidogyne enterolobii]
MKTEAALEVTPSNKKQYPLEITISMFKSTIYRWRPESYILISGSYLFKSLMPDSDIDMVVLLPNYDKFNEINLQYTYNLVFDEDKNSLYNILGRVFS